MRDAFRAFLGENDVVVDAWRAAGALLDCMRKHRIDMKHAGGKEMKPRPRLLIQLINCETSSNSSGPTRRTSGARLVVCLRMY